MTLEAFNSHAGSTDLIASRIPPGRVAPGGRWEGRSERGGKGRRRGRKRRQRRRRRKRRRRTRRRSRRRERREKEEVEEEEKEERRNKVEERRKRGNDFKGQLQRTGGASLRKENLGDGGKYVGVVANKLAPNDFFFLSSVETRFKKREPKLRFLIFRTAFCRLL